MDIDDRIKQEDGVMHFYSRLDALTEETTSLRREMIMLQERVRVLDAKEAQQDGAINAIVDSLKEIFQLVKDMPRMSADAIVNALFRS